jgi:hypothetical protein
MYLNFRQGLISFQQSGSQAFFLAPSSTSGYVDLYVSPTPLLATVAHGASDYLINVDSTLPHAWGPMNTGADNYLYLEVNLITGAVTSGISLLEPITSLVEPASASAQAGQMWFDLNANVMMVRNPDNSKWIVSPRIVIGKVTNGNVNQIVHASVGSTVGLNVPGHPGYLMLDSQLRPLRTSTGELLTTDSPVRVKTTIGTSGVLAQPINGFIPVRAAEPIPAMGLVYFSSSDTVSLASSDPALTSAKTPIGVIQQALALNEVGVVTQSGEITYDQWTWGPADFGKPLYCGFNGEITTSRPLGVQAFRIGYVKNAKTILFYVDSETQPQVVSSPGSIISGVAPISAVTGLNLNSEIVTTISMLPASTLQNGYMTSAQVTSLESFDTRITGTEQDVIQLETSKAPVAHTHAIANVTGLQSILDGKSEITHTHAEYALTGHSHSEFALTAHTHFVSDVTGLQNALNLKSDVGHNHIIADTVGLQDELDGKAFTNHTHSISSINLLQAALDGKAPVSHSHIIDNVTGLQAALDDRTLIGHTHIITDVGGLVDALAGKAETVHAHTIANVTGLQIILDGKAALSHAHAIGNITGLQTELDLKADVSHGHAISNITGLQTELNGKAPATHTHVVADVTDFDESVDTRVSNLLVAGTNVTLTYSNVGNSLTIDAASTPAPALPDTHLVFGTGTGISTSSNLSFRETTGGFFLNTGTTVATVEDVLIFGASALHVINDYTPRRGANVMISAGAADDLVDGISGAVYITGGGRSIDPAVSFAPSSIIAQGARFDNGTISIMPGYYPDATMMGVATVASGTIMIGGSVTVNYSAGYNPAMGNIILSAPSSDSADKWRNGEILLQTSSTDRLIIDGSGAFIIDERTGVAGEVLTSQGPGLTPVWAPVSGGGGGTSAPIALYHLNASTIFGSTTNAWTAVKVFESAVAPVTLDFYGTSFSTVEDGTYKITVSGFAIPTGGSWQNADTAFGTKLIAANAGISAIIVGEDVTLHNKPVLPASGNSAYLSTPDSRITWTDTYYLQAAALESFSIYAYTAAYMASGDPLDFRLTVEIQMIDSGFQLPF